MAQRRSSPRLPAFPRWLVIVLIMATAGITTAALLATGGLWRDITDSAPPVVAHAVARPGGPPSIVWGTPIGHLDRGPCTTCHAVVFPRVQRTRDDLPKVGQPRGAELPAISALSTMPHEFRGVCNNCHRIPASRLGPLIPVAETSTAMLRSAIPPAIAVGPIGSGSSPAIAYSTLALMVVLAVSRPRLGASGLRFTPGMAALLGVTVLALTGILTFDDMVTSALVQWRPLLALTCIMVMTGVLEEVGLFDRLALRIEAHARRTSAASAFSLVFLVSVITAALLNNDAAILLLTPLVVALTRRLWPHRPQMTVAFAFAVFLAPGVAPFAISNPMNMIVAEFAGIGFNDYARIMVPISIAGAALTYVILRLHFETLLASSTSRATSVKPRRPHPAEGPVLLLVLTVFGAYPVMAAFGGPVWCVSVAGAVGALLLATHYRVAPPQKLVRHVSPDILVFLWGVFLVVVGLRHVGVVARLASVYQSLPKGTFAEVGVVGGVAALGSALVDNHPMSLLNMMALGVRGDTRLLLAALIGGDIGPRLLPIGSLAGLLWMDLLRRSGVEIGAARFARVGTLVLLPTLALSLVMLWLLTAP